MAKYIQYITTRDEVAILNVSLDAWAVDVKANLEKGSSIHIISRFQ